MHEIGYVHNDLKLENIVIGHINPEVLYLIDFGLVHSIKKKDGSHIEIEKTSNFSGNFLFASVHSCLGNKKSRRDDMQSILNIMIYLLNDQSLPWSNFYTKYKNYEFQDHINERLKMKYTKRLYNMVSLDLKKIAK